MTMTLNNVTLANPTKCTRSAIPIGSRVRMGDATSKMGTTRVTPLAWAWTIELAQITNAQISGIKTAFDAAMKAYKTFVPLEGGSFNVRSIPESWRDEMTYVDGAYHYNVTMVVEQADPT
jgi:hypothetical protein